VINVREVVGEQAAADEREIETGKQRDCRQ
jgi:hypothetical protein